jgi:chromosome segregation ATPase
MLNDQDKQKVMELKSQKNSLMLEAGKISVQIQYITAQLKDLNASLSDLKLEIGRVSDAIEKARRNDSGSIEVAL